MCVAMEHAASLEELIAAGDWLNSSIFSLEELQTGLAKLTSDGFIEEVDQKFLLLDKAKLIFANHLSRYSAVDQQWNLLNALLHVSETEPIDTEKWPYPKLTYQMYRDAVEKYRNNRLT
jgi:hypothetical protein